MKVTTKWILSVAVLLVAAVPVFGQLSPSATWAVQMATQYQMAPNVTYRSIGGQDVKLDVYYRRGVTTPQPTLVYMHGGFWVAGNKEGALPNILPWMEMGWNVVNVEYRLGGVALAPAALEDCICALKFIVTQKNYNIDVNRIVVTGESAGGHLALSLGMIPESEGFGKDCPGAQPRPAAVINWFGVTDVPDVIDGPNRSQAAARWFGEMPNRMELARRLSPLTHARSGLPPILTIHGDADTTVPYAEGVRLHEALARTDTPNQLMTIPAGRHGGFTADQRTQIYVTIRAFLAKHRLMGQDRL